MDEKTLKILKSTFWALLAVALLWFSFRGVDWKEFWTVISSSRWGYVVLAMAAGALSFVIRSLRWRLLLLPAEPDIKRIDCYDGFTIGRLCDLAIPHIGEFVRCGYVQTPRMPFEKALGTVVLERAWDILMLGLLIFVLLVFRGEQYGSFFFERIVRPVTDSLGISPWKLLLALVLLVIVIFLAVWARRRHRSGNDSAPSSQKGSFFERLAGFFHGLGQGFSSFLKMKGKGWFILLTLLLWSMYLMMSWLIIKALPEDLGLNLVDALFIMLVGSVAGIVPVPGGFGAFHYIVAIALQTIYAIPFETGIIFATLSHESQTIMLILCGLLSYAHQTLKRRG
ncbi:MAG: flippase-like domain-containing protein [Bacteroidales bacterium]|nr:flippase-like domain-containing protein [Bacteroidales bacterium]MBR5055252.1 flippase-like domain-containing protein [Bacteroidales bacterium]